MGFIAGFLYFAPFFIMAVVVYALWRNQRQATESPLIDKTNFGPRVGAIVEVVLHPEHAAEWLRLATVEETQEIVDGTFKYWYQYSADVDGSSWDQENDTYYLVKVFPTMGMDSSEIYGIRSDDGVSS